VFERDTASGFASTPFYSIDDTIGVVQILGTVRSGELVTKNTGFAAF
jgi:hypothetical protein